MVSIYLSSYILSETRLKPNISLSGERDIPEMRSTASKPNCVRQRESAALPKPVRIARCAWTAGPVPQRRQLPVEGIPKVLQS